MNARLATFSFFIIAGGLFLAVTSFNFAVDPMCYYRCKSIDTTTINVNTYYHIGQIILAHPKTELVMVGSSRGETTSPIWLEKITGHPALNLSVGGTELQAKFAFLNIALAHNPIRKVIWQADFFELIPEILDVKMKSTEALGKYITSEFPELNALSMQSKLTSLFDHLTLNASVARFKKKNQKALDLGSGNDLNYERCESANYPGEKTTSALNKDIVTDFDRYRLSIFNHPASEHYWQLFVNKMTLLSTKNIEVYVLIAPYNPVFMKSLKEDYPNIYKAHQEWAQKLSALQIPNIHILNYFAGIPGDDGSVSYWGDGVHFTCKGAILMLKPSLAHLQ